MKEVLQLLLCSIVIQNIKIFYRGPVMFVVTCLFSEFGVSLPMLILFDDIN